MTCVFSPYIIERINGDSRYVRMVKDFAFYSDILGRGCCLPEGFIHDEESVPIIEGTNPIPGAIHDYFSRKDSDPIVTKEEAAAIYMEFQRYYDNLETITKTEKSWWSGVKEGINEGWDWIRRIVKTEVVEESHGYFHKHKVSASYKELTTG